MTELTYHKVMPISHQKAEKAFATGEIKEIADALVGLAYYDEDWEYVRDACLRFLEDEKEKDNYAIAATCLGHLARIHRKLELRKQIPLLKKFLNDDKIGGIIEDAI